MSGIELKDTTDLPKFTWEWTRWTPSDSILHHPDGRKEVIPGGWNHDHCDECYVTFSDSESGLKFGYCNEYDNWLCADCYAKHIAPYL